MGAPSFYLSARRFSTASGECDRHSPSRAILLGECYGSASLKSRCEFH
jgi:hypothetical protein